MILKAIKSISAGVLIQAGMAAAVQGAAMACWNEPDYVCAAREAAREEIELERFRRSVESSFEERRERLNNWSF